VGAVLDRQGATGIRILELPDRFTAIFAQDAAGAPDVAEDYSLVALLEAAGRRPIRARIRVPFQRSVTETYENRLRAIGYELEDAGAFTILLDELDDGMLITYQFYDPDAGFQLHKHWTIVSGDELARVITIATARRGKGTKEPARQTPRSMTR
jgi:hypothetical protein